MYFHNSVNKIKLQILIANNILLLDKGTGTSLKLALPRVVNLLKEYGRSCKF